MHHPPIVQTINKPLGGIGGPKSSDCRSKISDMCGDFRRNFEEIPTLPEQTAVKTVGFYSAAREKAQQSGFATLLTR